MCPLQTNTTEVCAFLFEEECCSTTGLVLVLKNSTKGDVCELRKEGCSVIKRGAAIKSMAVLPACTLEVWGHAGGLEDSEREEMRGKNYQFNKESPSYWRW